MAVSELPQGFVVDQPSSQAPASNTSASGTGNLPPGFVVDGDTTAQPKPLPEQWADTSNARLAARPSALAEQAQDPATLGRFIKHPVGTTLRTLQGAGELIQGVPSSIAMDLQQGKPQNILPDLGKVVTGQRPAQYGDVLAGAGAPEPLAKVGGLAMDTALTPGGAEGAVDLAKGAGNVIKSGAQAVGQKTGLFDLMKANQALKNPEKMAQDVRASLLDPKTGQKAQWGKDFEQRLNNLIAQKPYDSVNLQSEVSSMRSAMDDAETNPGLASQIKSVIRTIKNPDAAKTMSEIIDDPSKAANLTLKQSQDLKVAIQNTPAIKMKLAQGRFANYTQGDLELLDLLHNVKLKQAENFPELADVRQPYADKMTAYNLVKNKFKPGQLEGNIKNGFGDSEIESKVKSILPDATNKQIANIRQVLALKKAGKWAAGIAGVGSADAVIRKVTGQ